MHLLCKPVGHIVQGHDLLRENFWPILAGVDLADDKDRFALNQEFAILVVVLVHAKHLNRTLQVFESDHGVRFAILF